MLWVGIGAVRRRRRPNGSALNSSLPTDRCLLRPPLRLLPTAYSALPAPLRPSPSWPQLPILPKKQWRIALTLADGEQIFVQFALIGTDSRFMVRHDNGDVANRRTVVIGSQGMDSNARSLCPVAKFPSPLGG